MALKPKIGGKVPPSKPAPAKAAETAVATVVGVNMATAKMTISLKRRLGNGDEIFIAPGIELHCPADELDETQAAITERVKGWLDAVVAEFPDAADAEDDATDDAADADDEEGGELTAEDVDGMEKADLLTLITENALEIKNAKKMKVEDLREAVKEAVGLNDEEGDGEGDEDGDGDDDDSGTYTEEELAALGLEELQEICDSWEIEHPVLKKGADLKAKKLAYKKHILAAQEAAEEE